MGRFQPLPHGFALDDRGDPAIPPALRPCHQLRERRQLEAVVGDVLLLDFPLNGDHPTVLCREGHRWCGEYSAFSAQTPGWSGSCWPMCSSARSRALSICWSDLPPVFSSASCAALSSAWSLPCSPCSLSRAFFALSARPPRSMPGSFRVGGVMTGGVPGRSSDDSKKARLRESAGKCMAAGAVAEIGDVEAVRAQTPLRESARVGRCPACAPHHRWRNVPAESGVAARQRFRCEMGTVELTEL